MRMEVKKAAQLSLLGAQARRSALEMVYRATSGHLGGSMSLCEILSVLYFDTMRIDPAKPDDPDRDRFVLSKGHCTPALYSVLAMRGFFPREMLSTFRSIDGHLSGHAEMRHVPGVDMSTGSLGQGISTAVGMALAGQVDKKDYRVYVVLIKKDRLVPKMEGPKYLGAICETAGQFAYIYAIADTSHLAMSAPIISSYCAASVLWSRLFLKEKLSWKHYGMICLVVIGIAIMGIFDL